MSDIQPMSGSSSCRTDILPTSNLLSSISFSRAAAAATSWLAFFQLLLHLPTLSFPSPLATEGGKYQERVPHRRENSLECSGAFNTSIQTDKHEDPCPAVLPGSYFLPSHHWLRALPLELRGQRAKQNPRLWIPMAPLRRAKIYFR